MVVKVYISGISGNKEVKKRQQRVLMILDSKNVKYDVIDITEPGREADKDFMQGKSTCSGATVSDPSPRSPLPPQLFNDDEYCGDYDQFDMANEVDTLEQFLKVEVPPEEPAANETAEIPANGDVSGEKNKSKENSQERDEIKHVPKEGSPTEIAKEGTPNRNNSPGKDAVPLTDDEDLVPDKESTPERKSVENETLKTETIEADAAVDSKEKTPTKDKDRIENGSASSREVSVERAGQETKNEIREDDPSDAIQSEQSAASD